jgi:phospholipid/cholesterol/gamma-HCH transport system substrate-binding protein
MNDSRIAWKVGLFVAVGLALSALLILNFSKGVTLFKSTYKIHILMPTVAGLKPAADVMMAGVPVGKVAATTLSLDGRSVDITVEVVSKYQIHKDARFHIDALGFLGDQYIEVTPAEGDLAVENKVPLLTNGETITGETPLNMQEAVRSISDFVAIGQQTMRDIDTAVSNVNNTILDSVALTNFVATMTNFGSVTEDAAVMAKEVRGMLDSNIPSIHVAITNIAALAEKWDVMSDKLNLYFLTNADRVTDAVSNFNGASANMKQLTGEIEAGQGLAGSMVKDKQVQTNFAVLVAHLNDMAEQYTAFGQRLNEVGIWRALWKPSPSPTNAPGR